jgi:hypothetical protein
MAIGLAVFLFGYGLQLRRRTRIYGTRTCVAVEPQTSRLEGLTMAAEQSRKRQIAAQSRKRQIAEDNPREIRKVIAQMEESLRVLSGIAQHTRAKKLLISGAAITGAALVAKRLASRSSGLDFGKLFERMPENAPPKLMFRNISAIRENTERILQLLESERTTPGPQPRQDPAV